MLGSPNPYNLSKKYARAVHLEFLPQYPPVRVPVPSWLLSLESSETLQHTSHSKGQKST